MATSLKSSRGIAGYRYDEIRWTCGIYPAGLATARSKEKTWLRTHKVLGDAVTRVWLRHVGCCRQRSLSGDLLQQWEWRQGLFVESGSPKHPRRRGATARELSRARYIECKARGRRTERADGMEMMRKRNVQDLGDASCRGCGCRCVARAQICRDEAAGEVQRMVDQDWLLKWIHKPGCYRGQQDSKTSSEVPTTITRGIISMPITVHVTTDGLMVVQCKCLRPVVLLSGCYSFLFLISRNSYPSFSSLRRVGVAKERATLVVPPLSRWHKATLSIRI